MDQGLGKAMSEVEDDEEVDLQTAQAILQDWWMRPTRNRS